MIPDQDYRTPGQLIQHLLDTRGWTQRVLAIVLGVDETGLNKIVSGKRAVDAGMALALGEVFGVPAEQFLELQKVYDLAMARLLFRPDPMLATRLRVFSELPVADTDKAWMAERHIRHQGCECRRRTVPVLWRNLH